MASPSSCRKASHSLLRRAGEYSRCLRRCQPSSPRVARVAHSFLKTIRYPGPATNAGRALPLRRGKFCSEDCATSHHNSTRFRVIVSAIASRRADPKRSQAASLAIGKKASLNAANRNAWRDRPEWSESGDEALRHWHAETVYPALTRCKVTAIMTATGLSKQFSITLRAGPRIPHPRHFAALAELAGIAMPACQRRDARASNARQRRIGGGFGRQACLA